MLFQDATIKFLKSISSNQQLFTLNGLGPQSLSLSFNHIGAWSEMPQSPTFCPTIFQPSINSAESKNLSNLLFTLPSLFDHVNLLPIDGISTNSNKSINSLNSLISLLLLTELLP